MLRNAKSRAAILAASALAAFVLLPVAHLARHAEDHIHVGGATIFLGAPGGEPQTDDPPSRSPRLEPRGRAAEASVFGTHEPLGAAHLRAPINADAGDTDLTPRDHREAPVRFTDQGVVGPERLAHRARGLPGRG